MKISFIVNYIYIDGGWSPWSKRVGGSEEMVIETSKRLAARGHEVQVFHNGQHGTYEGVKYRDHSEYEPGDITVNMNYPQFPVQGRTVLWTSLTEHPDLTQFDAVCAISSYALENTGIIHENTYIVPPGYDKNKIYPGKKVLKRCLYASSPDRGLDTLRQIWPSVQLDHSDAELIVTYGGDGKEYTEEEMNEFYRTSDIWVHPCNGGELFGITAVKAQAAGCIPVYFPIMALQETVQGGVPCTDARDMYYQLCRLLGDEDRKKELRDGLTTNHYVDWDESVTILESILKRYT